MLTATHYTGLALIAGIGIPIMASINGALGVRLASTTAAATVLFFGAFVIALLTLWITELPATQTFLNTPPHLYIGGIFVAFYVLSITWLVPRFGIGNAIFFVLLGQVISASIIGHFGLLYTQAVPLSGTRLMGVVLIAIGALLFRSMGK